MDDGVGREVCGRVEVSAAAAAAFMGPRLTPWPEGHGYYLQPLRGGLFFWC